jgi:hypothetical protein
MKKIYTSIALVALSMLAAMPMSAQNVRKVTVGETTGYGLTYSLPQTLVAVTVETECTSVKAGKYAQYAERYLGVKDAAQTDVDQWKIVGVTLTPVAEPDTARTYQIKFEKGNNPTCYLTEDGILWSINMAPTDTPERPVESVTVVSEPSRIQVTNSDLLKAGSAAKQAEIAAGQIFRIRESRLDILTGEADNLPSDGAAYKVVLENLEAQEQAYLALFTGEQTVRRVKKVYLYRPESGEQTLFRFSKYYGFVGTDDLSGEPVKAEMQVLTDKRSAQEELEKTQKKSASKNQGVAFISAGKAAVSVKCQGAKVAEGEFYLGQLGSVEQLPTSLFVDKKNVVKATFNPVTGAINLYEQQ